MAVGIHVGNMAEGIIAFSSYGCRILLKLATGFYFSEKYRNDHVSTCYWIYNIYHYWNSRNQIHYGKVSGVWKNNEFLVVGLQSFPSVAWVPFAILLIGLNDFGILFVVIMSSVFSVMMSTYSGIRNIPPLYIRASRNMGAKGFSLFRFVMIPAATPSLLVGIKQAWSFAWHALIGAEILIAPSVGLGHILLVGREFRLINRSLHQ